MNEVSCRSCGANDLRPVLNLGRVPLANDLPLHAADSVQTWPLRLAFCPACGLGQLLDTVDPSRLFDDYRYFSSQSSTMVEHAAGLVDRHVRPGARVVEIASNDGCLLRAAQSAGAEVLGVDPAANVAEHAVADGVPTRVAYFDESLGHELRREFGAADVVFACNVLAHVPDPNQIAAGIAALLAPDGVAHLEFPSLHELVLRGAFDTVYHEHYSVFSAASARALFNRHGLRVIGAESIGVHGGSLHLQVARHGEQTAIDRLIAAEEAAGLLDGSAFRGLAQRVRGMRRALRQTLDEFETVAAYGAAAKGVMLLNCFGLDADRVPWVADISPHKQGRFVPGTGQPIVSPDHLLRERPDACLLLPWNLREEISRQHAAYLAAGGRFIVPIPHVEVIDAVHPASSRPAAATMERSA